MKKTKEDPLRFYHSRINCVKTNATTSEMAAFEREMVKYCANLRRLFKWGLVSQWEISNLNSNLLYREKQDQLREKLEAFEARQKATNRAA